MHGVYKIAFSKSRTMQVIEGNFFMGGGGGLHDNFDPKWRTVQDN